MGDRKLPPEVLRVIESADLAWSDHADTNRVRLGLQADDVADVARTGLDWKRTRDAKGVSVDGWVDAVTGRDRSGRWLYMAGKVVDYRGERRWYVITIHEADE